MKRSLTILTSLLILLTACEKEIPIDVDDMEPQVVVRAQGNTDSPLSATITMSRPVFGTYYTGYGSHGFPQVTNATASLSVNGGSATYTAMRDSNSYTFPYTPQSGDRLTLSIDVPGHETLTATTTVPQEPIVGSLSYVEHNSTNIDGYTSTNISIFVPLTDRAASTDYYAISMYRTDTVCYTYYDSTDAVIDRDTLVNVQDWFECQDQLVVTDINMEDMLEGVAISTFYGDEMLFTDERMNGQTHSIELMTYFYQDNYYFDGRYRDNHYNDRFTYVIHSTYVVEVSSLSYDDYLYRKTIQAIEYDDLFNIFSEPVQIHSNITGGIGIFGVSPKRTFTLQHDYQP